MTESKSIFERGLWRNPMSYLGMLLSIGSALTILVLLVIDFLAALPSPYFGVLLFFILPVLFMAGSLLIIWGMWDEHKRRRKDHTEIPKFPILDLNETGHRVRFFVFMAGTVFAVILLTVIAYQAYHFTESRVFCGDLCHNVMAPEATAAQNSPHARVLCAECHVGPGAGWYVKSKLAGTRQLFAVLLKTYPKPIPPAIEHLRPARETCEECHWPEKFYGSKMRVRTHFGFDEKNTPHDVSMLVKIGGGENSSGEGGSGIHWHMLSEEKVTFRAADPGLQVIPVVWDKQSDGTVVEYRLQGYKAKEGSEGGGKDMKIRLVDCVVCHNRPTHIYSSPQRSMDKALLEGAIDHTLPYIKREGVRVLVGDYKTKEQAFGEIESRIKEFYDEKYPGVAASRADDISRAIKAIQHIYDQNFFPSMNVSWKMYPDNIGHRDSPGCFRCHDGRHVSKDGKVIRRKCTICHTMPESGPSKHWAEGYPEGEKWETWHPWDLKGKHALMNCSDCHTGGMLPPRDCATCHEEKNVTHYSKDGGMSDFECSDCHEDLQKVRPLVECTDCHDDLGGLHVEVEDHQDAGCTTCHRAHLWVVDNRDTCYQCHDDKKDHNPGDFCGECHEFD